MVDGESRSGGSGRERGSEAEEGWWGFGGGEGGGCGCGEVVRVFGCRLRELETRFNDPDGVGDGPGGDTCNAKI